MSQAADLIRRMTIPHRLRQLHTVDQLMLFAEPLLATRPGGVLVEAGCYQGLSTARLSHLADMLDTTLVVFDSFQGLPANREPHHRSITGRSIRGWFRTGTLAATLAEARATVADYGVPGRVEWIPGWFADTMPTFARPVTGAFLDVDLAASTRTCLQHLWPLLGQDGLIVSQDGHLPLVVAEMRAWAADAAPPPVRIEGLGEQQMVRIFR